MIYADLYLLYNSSQSQFPGCTCMFCTKILVVILDDMLGFKFTNLSQVCAHVKIVAPCLGLSKFIVTVRVSLFHRDVIVRLLDMLFVRPLKQEYTCLLKCVLRLSQLIMTYYGFVTCLVCPLYGFAWYYTLLKNILFILWLKKLQLWLLEINTPTQKMLCQYFRCCGMTLVPVYFTTCSQ